MIMIEYAHAMGNSVGILNDYWKIIDNSHCLQGGFIWEWMDHALQLTNEKGQKYWGYGKDYHPDMPTDGNFMNDGLVAPDRTPHPHMAEVKKVYQPVRFHDVDAAAGQFEVENRYDFIGLDHLDIRYQITADGHEVAKGSLGTVTVAAGERQPLFVSLSGLTLEQDKEYLITLSAVSKNEDAFVGSGFEYAWDQFNLTERPAYQQPAMDEHQTLELHQTDDAIEVKGADFAVHFDRHTGQMTEFTVAGRAMIRTGIEPNFWRGLTDNDLGAKAFEWADIWRNAGKERQLSSITVAAPSHHELQVATRFTLPTVASEYTLNYTIFADGEIRVETLFTPGDSELPMLMRVGTQLTLPC